jgi:hypothetical protein
LQHARLASLGVRLARVKVRHIISFAVKPHLPRHQCLSQRHLWTTHAVCRPARAQHRLQLCVPAWLVQQPVYLHALCCWHGPASEWQNLMQLVPHWLGCTRHWFAVLPELLAGLLLPDTAGSHVSSVPTSPVHAGARVFVVPQLYGGPCLYRISCYQMSAVRDVRRSAARRTRRAHRASMGMQVLTASASARLDITD